MEQVYDVWWPKLEAKLKNLPVSATINEIATVKTESNFIESDGIFWKPENTGWIERYSPHCPECH